MRITHAQPLMPGPEGGQLEPRPVLTPEEAAAEAAALGPFAFDMQALAELPPEWLGEPVERFLAGGAPVAYTHRVRVVDPPALDMPPSPLACHDYLMRIEP